MSETECVHCGATDEPDQGISVRVVGELGATVCTICLPEDSNPVMSPEEGDE
jgi:hypothetical protein